MQEVNIPFTLAELGIDPKEYAEKIPLLAEKAFEDQVTITNPRLPWYQNWKNYSGPLMGRNCLIFLTEI